MDLVELLKCPEGKTLEFKRDLSGSDGALKTIVAFANTAGGIVLVGVEDRTGHVRGVASPLDLEERLANLISDHVAPRLVPEIEILRWRRTQVVAVQVHPSPGRPHYLKRDGLQGGTYVRVGSTNRRADRELIEELRRFARAEVFDEQPMPGVDSEALDFRAASESFAGTRRLARRDLETLRLLTEHQGRKVPTVGGMLLLDASAHTISPTRGSRRADSPAPTGVRLSTAPRSAPCRCGPSRTRSPSSRSTRCAGRRSERCDARSAGTCRLSQYARQ